MKCICKCFHAFGLHLQHLAVIGEKAVRFIFHVADLCQNGGAETAVDHRDDLIAVKLFQSVGKGFFRLNIAITIGLIQFERVPRDLAGLAAEFREDERFFADLQIELFEIDMLTLHVTLRFEKPA